MDTETISFTEEKATALLTLSARARQSGSDAPVLDDPWAERAITRIAYDFDQIESDRWRERLIAARAKQFDTWTREFLATHPRATVLHLGCGLDSRVYRVDPPTGVRWLDVDYPDIIDLRRRLYPERGSYEMIGTALGDLAWLNEVSRGGPVLVVAEGVTPYLTRDVLKTLLHAVTSRFSGGQFAFDVHSRRLVQWLALTKNSVRGTGAQLHWGMGSPADIPKLEPRLALVSCLRAAELARTIALPWPRRLLLRVLGAMTCLRYRF